MAKIHTQNQSKVHLDRGIRVKTVCLITPPSIFLLDERVFMNIGILKIAAVLEAHGVAIEMLDLSGVQGAVAAMEEHAKDSDARFFGITATTPQIPAATIISRAIKRVRSDAVVVLGGPHVTLVNAARKREVKESRHGRAHRAYGRLQEEFDVLVAGDGEEACELVFSDRAPKLVDADEPGSPLFLTSKRLTELPLPARHLVDVDSYHYSIDGHRAISVIAQLGCPYGCGFCAGRDSPFLRKIRTRTTASILHELVALHTEYGFTGFMFYDDELNVNKNMIELMNEICGVQKALSTEWRLRGFVKSELFTEQQADAMYRAGFRWLLVGFESGSDRILKNINKRASREENTRCIEIARRHGLKVKALMSIGHPGENWKTVEDTKQWLLETKPNDFDITIITPYPGSPYYDYARFDGGSWVYETNGDHLFQVEIDYTEVSDYYKGNPDGGYASYVFTDGLDREDLVRLRDDAERRVREHLDIPYNQGAPAIQFEHSMGQSLPRNILRRSRGYRSDLAEQETLGSDS